MRQRTLWLVLVVVAGLCLWLVAERRRQSGATAREQVQGVAKEAREVPEPLREARAASAPAVPAERSSVPSEVRAADVLEPLELRVVDRAGASVPGAEVFLLDWATSERSAELDGALASVERTLERLGERRVAGATGAARFPLPRARSTAAARDATRFAIAELLPAEPGPIVLVLEDDPPVCVRVVDASGAPVAGVGVDLVESAAKRSLLRATTGSDGIAELRAREQRAALRKASAFVRLAMLAREPVEASVDVDLPPREPIELRLPESGAVEVELVGSQEAVREPVRVWVQLTNATQDEIGVHASEFSLDERWTRAGRARFWPVGLGLELRVGVESREREDRMLVVSGPVEPGESVAVRLELGRALPVITGRVVDPERRPIGPATLLVWAMQALGDVGATTSVDADGRFRCAFDELAEVDRVKLEIRSPPGLEAWAELGDPRLVDGVNDLGEIVLAPSPILVAGVVRDESGAPLRAAHVFGTFTRAPQGTGSVDLRTDALGRFESRERADGAVEISLWVQADGYQQQLLAAIPAGASDLEIVLAHGGWIAGRLEFTGSLFPTLQVTRDGAPVLTSQSFSDRGFRLGPLPSGRYSLACGYPWCDARVVVDELDVVAGEETRDARLDPLDLRTLLARLSLEVVDEADARLAVVCVSWMKSGGEFVNLYARREGDAWTVAAPSLPVRVQVVSPGFRPLELELDADRRVVLERGRALRIELDGAPAQMRDGWHLAARLAWDGERLPYRDEQRLDFPDGVAACTVSRPGRYELAFYLAQIVGGEDRDGPNLWDSSTWVEVGEGNEPAVVRVSAPTAEEIAARLDESR